MVSRKGSARADALPDQVALSPWAANANGVSDSSSNDKSPAPVYDNQTTLPVDDIGVSDRPQWGNKWEFILSHIGCCIGLGNVWRFPYVCYKNGGGAFFIPYLLCLITTGVPVVFLEIAVGQYFATGGISVWDISPIFRGVGYGTTLMAGWLNVYYIVVLSWGLLYLFYTLYYIRYDVPWSTCDNAWNTPNCSVSLLEKSNETKSFLENVHNVADNVTRPFLNRLESAQQTPANQSKVDPTTEFWERQILKISTGIDDVGEVQWQLAVTLLIMWIICYFCVWKGVKSSGKVVYFTALFPYVMLIILFFRGVTLPHAIDGIIYYLKPEISKLGEANVWVGAVTQVFFSYAIALGSLTALGSYNKFDYNCYKHSLALCACDSLTSIFAGFVVFSVLGFMAHEMGVEVKDVAESGPGLAFIAYPKAAAQMPVGALWAILFFLMLLFLGMDSQFVTMEGFFTAVMDAYPKWFRKKYSKEGFIAVCCVIWFFLGFFLITRGGMYVFELMDTFAASGVALLWFAFWECTCVGWFYGADRFYEDISRMLGYSINPWMKFCWKYAGPFFTSFIMIFAIVMNEPLRYNRVYLYPDWAQALCWVLAGSSMVAVPIYAIYRLSRETGTLRERFQKSIKSVIKLRPEAVRMIRKDPLLPQGINGRSS
ncbi:sodium- and chloride-dependent GABA transporter 2-like [Paramacrobiotus metropolitanus]|uniref:sodium- and chloride-dependent GABA transporter 2-like n=1 Tax=Paramacrobiotus metropolitanus TaxID=2943436 RepID=UPI0024459C81|nr:sodium- and chloride-dependent GABA transporter 2-like [Paramacrobiotus metropolitanus]XP_055338318.1 sodium- and chloride-dependent GABA transporter 2-like [Paramacrobiotus metropolitanus]XP_055338319.1 sodium- and chloride-dependent GABA transporter 2-like [Paramacrobiotus metropolitanus]XP_055338320.1 sodium- and chloride-dependent GABA transporter 2-like [Paramacrobiotus metropolitanus]